MPEIDLNSDVGESFGRWMLGDDAAMMPSVTSANVACGFHAGDPTHAAPHLRARRRGRRHRRRPGRLPGPRRLRPAVHRHGPGRADRRHHLPDRRAAGAGRRRRDRGQLRQAARRALQRRPFTTSVQAPRGRRRRPRRRRRPAGARAARLGAAGASPKPAVCGRSREAFADRGYTPEGTLVPRSQPGALLHDPAEVAARMVRLVTDGVITAVDGQSHGRRRESSACTATAPAPSRWPPRCGRRCRTPASRCGLRMTPRLLPRRRPRAAGRRPTTSEPRWPDGRAPAAGRGCREVEDLIPAAETVLVTSPPAPTSPSSATGSWTLAADSRHRTGEPAPDESARHPGALRRSRPRRGRPR